MIITRLVLPVEYSMTWLIPVSPSLVSGGRPAEFRKGGKSGSIIDTPNPASERRVAEE